MHLLGAVWLPVTASILPRASDPHTGVSHGVRAARCCCVSYTTARPPWASLVKCLMRLSGNPANSLCPVSYPLTVTWPFLCRSGCARASSPFPSPGTSGTGVQGTPGTPGSMHPCVLGPRVWALLHTGPDWPRGGGEGGACLHLQIAPPPSTGEKAQKHQTSPPPFGPPRCEPQSDCSETVMHLENAGSATWEIAALPEAGGASRAGWSRFGHFSSYVQVSRKDTSGSVR